MVGCDGIAPPLSETTDLQSVRFLLTQQPVRSKHKPFVLTRNGAAGGARTRKFQIESLVTVTSLSTAA